MLNLNFEKKELADKSGNYLFYLICSGLNCMSIDFFFFFFFLAYTMTKMLHAVIFQSSQLKLSLI